MKRPISEVEDDFLFKPMPLDALLENGVEYMIELAKR